MSTQYTVSILVPTHNRSRYAISCIRSLLAIDSPHLQIVVHDTSNDDCELRNYASKISDRRLRYVYHSERLSMTDNHEAALSHAEGEFLCLIGDDDSILPSILDAAQIAQAQSLDVIVPTVSATYSWPDFRTRFFGGAHSGKLYLADFSNRFFKVDSKIALRSGLSNAFQGTDGLPKLYHGLVRRRLIDGIRTKYGRFFYGTSPDASAAVSLSLATEHFHVWDNPFTIPGASGGSNTGRSALNKHKGDFKTDPHMAAFQDLAWDDVIPKFFSVETVWANAAWETLRNMNRHSDMARFNLNRVYALCLMNHRDYFNVIFESIKIASERGSVNLSRGGILKEFSIALFDKFNKTIRRASHPSPSNGRKTFGPYADIFEAQRGLVGYLSGISR